MKYLLCILLYFIPLQFFYAQNVTKKEVYEKIKNYYINNPINYEYVEYKDKNVLKYDTTLYQILLLKNVTTTIPLVEVFFDTAATINYLLYQGEKLYTVSNNTKQVIKQSVFKDNFFWNFDKFPFHNIDNLETVYGKIKSVINTTNELVVTTNKLTLFINSNNYKINKIIITSYFDGKIDFKQLTYHPLNDSLLTKLKQQVVEIINNASESKINYDSIYHSKQKKLLALEGSKFIFDTLNSFNKGLFTKTNLAGKYIILDFFYQSCLPCHKMTDYILDWLPTIDNSKIILIGVDPFDKETSMSAFVKERNINYPILIEKEAKKLTDYYPIQGYPTLFLISPEGIIENIHVGMSKNFLKTAKKLLDNK